MPEQDRVQFNRPRRMRKLKNENEALMASAQMMAGRIDVLTQAIELNAEFISKLKREVEELKANANAKPVVKRKPGRPPIKRDNNGG